MTLFTFSTTLLVVFILSAFHHLIVIRNSALRHLPGPAIAKVTGYYRVWLLSTGRGPQHYLGLHRRYGSVVQTGPSHVSFSDPRMIPIIYDLKSKFHKSHFYNVFKPLYQGAPMDTIFTTANARDKRDSRNQLVNHMTSCPYDFRVPIRKSVMTFVGCMCATASQPVDLTTWPFYWGLDMTFALMFGEPYGFMKHRGDFNGLVIAFTTAARAAALIGQVPQWWPYLSGSPRFMKFGKKWVPNFPDPTQELLCDIEQRIDGHDRMPHDCGETFLCRVLEDRKQGGGSQYETVNLLFESFFAASIESAVTIRSIIWCLMTHQSVYQRLVREIRHSSQNDSLTSRPNGELSTALPFVNAVIKEVLRLHTSNCPPMERVVPSSGLTYEGHFIPEGTIVSVAHYVTHRDKAVYGDDAEAFRPERWLEADPGRMKKMEHNFMAFGKGSRACAGRELGMIELRMFLVEVLQRFDLQWAHGPPAQPRVDMYWIIEQHGLVVRFKERQSDTKSPVERQV